jgi:uroporphyrinogen decarboxylase
MKEYKPDFERLKKVLLRDGEPDIIPFFELYIDGEIIREVTGKPVNHETRVEFYYKLGFNHVTVGVGLGYKTRLIGTVDTAELSHGTRYFPDESQGVISDRKDFDSYPWPILDSSIISPVHETIKYLPDGMKVIISTADGLFENMMSLMGYTPFSYALYDDEQLIWDIFEIIGANYVNTLKLCLEHADISKIGAVDISDDMGFNQGTLIAPELLRKYVLPWQKKAAELAHSYELPVIMHSCGNLESIMDDLINYVGIDAKHSFEDKIMPVIEAKKKYGNRIALLGGVDVNFLCVSNEEQIRKHVDDIIDVCAPGGGFALGSGNSFANYIPIKNYLTMLDECRKKGVYPIR